MFNLRIYQDEAVSTMESHIYRALARNNANEKFTLNAPTGSGKTVMMAELIKRLVKNDEWKDQLSFIWISVHNLHNQSKDKLIQYYENSIIDCVSFNDIDDSHIAENQILFLNWESVRTEINTLRIKNERGFDLSNITSNTRDAHRIILIIDESHHSANTELADKVIEIIDPKITINVSATPKPSGGYPITVPIQDVKDEGVIKNSILFNIDLIDEDLSANKLLLNTAISKQNDLRRRYKALGSDINPLLLVQIPDNNENMKDEIIKMFEAHNMIFEDGTLALYLSGAKNKINIDDITNNKSRVNAVIFKQAAALGWDCPRACILLIFRELHGFVFSIQTLGRIMRMPELKHYDDDILNHAYVYSNIDTVKVAKEFSNDYFLLYTSTKRDDLDAKMRIDSVYVQRSHEKTRLTSEFTTLFKDIAQIRLPFNHINLNARPTEEILENVEINILDIEQHVEGDTTEFKLDEAQMQRLFDNFLKLHTGNFATVHSAERIKTAVYAWFKSNNIHDVTRIQELILAKENKSRVSDIISRAREKFQHEISNKAQNELKNKKWFIPDKIHYPAGYKIKNGYGKSIMQPLYLPFNTSQNEQNFMKFLNENKHVEWWFKNGVSTKKSFAITYHKSENNKPALFYVDFIVKLKNGSIWLLDPKDGNTITDLDTAPKANALAEYLDKTNNDSKIKMELFGGITTNRENRWVYSQNTPYVSDTSTWQLLDFEYIKTREM